MLCRTRRITCSTFLTSPSASASFQTCAAIMTLTRKLPPCTNSSTRVYTTSTSGAITQKEELTPLAKYLQNSIKLAGTMSVAHYMRQVLTNPHSGYYMGGDVFGAQGDFITSPEISQMFGEVGDRVVTSPHYATSPISHHIPLIQVVQCVSRILASWYLVFNRMDAPRPSPEGPDCRVWPRPRHPHERHAQGTSESSPFTPRFKHITATPIDATNTKPAPSFLQALAAFPHCYRAISSVYLVETSPGLSKMQLRTLCGEDAEAKEGPDRKGLVATRKDGIEVQWHNGFEEVFGRWSSRMSFLMRCLSISLRWVSSIGLQLLHDWINASMFTSYSFSWLDESTISTPQKTKDGWRELRVDLDESDTSSHHFRVVLNPLPNQASAVFADTRPDFASFPIGSRVEISPESRSVVRLVARHVDDHGGAALAIDYGKDYVQGDTFRAIMKHKFMHPMSRPGEADLSADVDFRYLKDAVKEFSGATAYGPIYQSHFLHSLGIQERLKTLIQGARGDDRCSVLVSSYKRLVEPLAMGHIYKVMAITPKSSEGVPVAFEEWVAEEMRKGVKG
ncbi:putative S-adenosyl-L-methionine-dependent methyltransferase-domain-containing protein [Jimgerdemannia flammicorona]|uniref:Protein arginine methyltransferase NDUFAF7 n=1 Tax=Jimgerdemannia flammicorona TaxID=994334 RepID=A0A433DKE4_9FUNG|nr:putative S-adenosyl-L-methionine-dependent methyltransferase-domain-containing protein [Jimgerdemannia flammicorona]